MKHSIVLVLATGSTVLAATINTQEIFSLLGEFQSGVNSVTDSLFQSDDPAYTSYLNEVSTLTGAYNSWLHANPSYLGGISSLLQGDIFSQIASELNTLKSVAATATDTASGTGTTTDTGSATVAAAASTTSGSSPSNTSAPKGTTKASSGSSSSSSGTQSSSGSSSTGSKNGGGAPVYAPAGLVLGAMAVALL
ncbi:hypothetical protein CAAN1_17S01838 [[Candida] anglica]|uniref:Temperature shock-inducible protein 1 n=1 Tax=[Candida] anglica TaxID=148631 RepID=A0ABP0E7E6_9ASCO